MMKNWKRLPALLLSGAMVLSLCACKPGAAAESGAPESTGEESSSGGFWDFFTGLFSGKESPAPSAEVSTDPAASASPAIEADLSRHVLDFAAGLSPDDVLLTVNGEQLPADLVLYWLNYTCYYFTYQYGMYGMNPGDYADMLLDDAVSVCAREVLLRQHAARLGCLPTDAQAQSAREQMNADPDTLELFRTGYGLTDASIEYLFLADAYYDNMLQALTHDPSEEELADFLTAQGLYRVKHILISTVDENRQPLPDDQIAEKRAQAEALLAELQGTSAEELPALFDRRMNELSGDGRDGDGNLYAPDGYLAAPGQMVAAFEQASSALQPGQLSGLVETDFGYHIILRLPMAPLTDEERDTYQPSFRPAALQDLADQWALEADIVRSDALAKLDVADFYARMNAYRQALSERDAAGSAPAESGGVG